MNVGVLQTLQTSCTNDFENTKKLSFNTNERYAQLIFEMLSLLRIDFLDQFNCNV